MISLLTNGLLTSPVPIQFTGNYCSHNCSYCFANINNPKRKLDVKAVASQLRNFKTRNDLVSYYMRKKYPLIISNNIDPFSKSNQPFVNEFIFQLQDLGIPVVLATRGGIGWQNIADNISPSVWYVSIPYDNEDIKNHYEPQAPSIEERWQLIEHVIKKGHNVILSINPLNHNFTKDPVALASRAKELGVKTVLINKLHLTFVQQANMTENQKRLVGEPLLAQAAKSREFEHDWLSMAIDLYNLCNENDMNLIGMDTGLKQSNFAEFKECYNPVLPTVYDFFNWCYENKKDGDYIYFDEWFDFFSKLIPDIEGDISKYIVNKAVIGDKDFYKKMSIENILHLYWEHPKLNMGLAKYYPSFSWVKEQTAKKLDYIYDKDHNKVLLYHKEKFYTDESYTIQ